MVLYGTEYPPPPARTGDTDAPSGEQWPIGEEAGEARNLADQLAVKLEVPCSEGTDYLQCKEIVSLHADGSYTEIRCLRGRSRVVSRNLNRVLALVPPRIFFRCHRSHAINLWHVERLIRKDGFLACLHGDIMVPVSVRQWSKLREALRKF